MMMMLYSSAVRSNQNCATFHGIIVRTVLIRRSVLPIPTISLRQVSTTTDSTKLTPSNIVTTRNGSVTTPPMMQFMNHHSTLTTTTSRTGNNSDTSTAQSSSSAINDPFFASTKAGTNAMTYHTGTITKQATDVTFVDVPSTITTTAVNRSTVSSSLSLSWMKRWIVTVEVAISKIFPGGFGWQTGSLLAANHYHYMSDSMNFALCTGIGDAIGVFGGHCLYYYMKQSMLPSSQINMMKEVHTGAWLGCAAFCSGTVWQPIVTTLQLSGCTFTQVMVGTWITCSAAFYIGLRAGRTLLPLSTLPPPTYDNSQTDVALSISIGGATGFFVGTDTAYLPEQNFLLPVVGITETTTDLVGCTLAGKSTALGFVTSQSVLNTIYPKEKCWND